MSMIIIAAIFAGLLVSGAISSRCGEGFAFGFIFLPGVLTSIVSLAGFLVAFMAAEIFGFGNSKTVIEYGFFGFFAGLVMLAVGYMLLPRR